MLSWKYNRFGHVEIWKGKVWYPEMKNNEADLYLQDSTDVESFFKTINVNMERVSIDDWDFAEDKGCYFL
jgi:hypothetical protein